MTAPDQVADKLRQILESAVPRLQSITAAQASAKLSPEKWSKKEILGHLIDSAANNHCRFVTGQCKGDLHFAGYEQEKWVAVQRYQEADWRALIRLWSAYNHHLAFLMGTFPEADLLVPHDEHSLDLMAFNLVPANQPTTMLYLMQDYVDHLLHHVKQIIPGYNLD